MNRSLRALSALAAISLLFEACKRPTSNSAFEAKINAIVVPVQTTIADGKSGPLPVGASRDDKGIQSDFVEGSILLRPKNDADLESFLQRFEGTVIRTDTIPEPPPELGVTLTAEQRKPTQYTVRINLAKVNVAALSANAANIGLQGRIEFSSNAAMQTLAAIVEAKAAGYRASANYVYYGDQTFPLTLLITQERQTSPGPPPVFTDPFTNAAYADFGATGNQSNVFLAWQFVAAHGIKRRARVAIIDSGFYLDGSGMARGNDSDFPPPPGRPTQYDVDFQDGVASDPGPGSCGAGNPCWWHGTGSAGVATGIANNRLGAFGTGGLVADPMLFRVNGTKGQRNLAIRTAISWGADVVSMSFGGNCNTSCRIDDRDDNPFDVAVNSGSRVVFVSSAGNGQGTPATGYDVGAPSFFHPCIEDHVICVGALNPGANTKTGYSNFGGQVQIFAPTNIPVMSAPPSFGPTGNPLPLAQADGPAVPQTFGGTSASAPFVAGVAAMMKALNPDLNHNDVARILRETAQPGTAPQVTRTLNAFAAVKRAAEGIPMVADTGESNDVTPTNLGSFATYNQLNLNLDNRDRDYFRFDSPSGCRMTIELAYPNGLGAISVLELESTTGGCGKPYRMAEAPLISGGKTLTYQVPGGPMKLGLRADDINAYNLKISFGARVFRPDSYEPNDTPATAKRINSVTGGGSGMLGGIRIDARVTIDATLHNNSDLDHYIVRGAKLSSVERILFVGYPAVKVYGNDSRIKMEVFRLKPDNTPGPQISTLTGDSCTPNALTVRLDEDVSYLVKISGTAGQYTLRNGVDGEARRFPALVRDRVYEVLHPGEPIEHELRFPELYIFPADRAARAIRSAGPNAHLTLFDQQSNRIAEGTPGPNGENLALPEMVAEQIYALEVSPRGNAAEPPRMSLEWDMGQQEPRVR